MTIWLITIIHSTTDSKHKAFPKWMESSGFQLTTSSNEFNQVITVLLKTSMFLAGAIGCFLDNTVPGKKMQHFYKLVFCNLSSSLKT